VGEIEFYLSAGGDRLHDDMQLIASRQLSASCLLAHRIQRQTQQTVFRPVGQKHRVTLVKTVLTPRRLPHLSGHIQLPA
jgi:hypothetical protein